jgi:hypothetical protein
MKKLFTIAAPMVLMVLVASCGGNSTLDNDESVVFLTVNIDLYNPDIDVCSQAGDISVDSFTITWNAKDPDLQDISAAQDVNLTRWVVTPERVDGGTTTSPVWSHDVHVHVPAEGQADLSNWRVYPLEYLDDLPLSYLFPENGGFDPETGNTNIRQTLNVRIYGRTVSGKAIATPVIPFAFNFTCQ